MSETLNVGFKHHSWIGSYFLIINHLSILTSRSFRIFSKKIRNTDYIIHKMFL